MIISEPENQVRLQEYYNTYNFTIKPLLAAIEARYESFPLPVINEIRAFNDHIAQCYREEITSGCLQPSCLVLFPR